MASLVLSAPARTATVPITKEVGWLVAVGVRALDWRFDRADSALARRAQILFNLRLLVQWI